MPRRDKPWESAARDRSNGDGVAVRPSASASHGIIQREF
jgi:hypothetical protein